MGNSQHPQVVLASASPRRRELLRQIGVVFRAVVADIDETPFADEAPADYVVRMAREKALTVLELEGDSLPVLGSDTAVILEGRILGKPVDREDAVAMLNLMSGKTHEVFSAVVVAQSKGKLHQALSVSRVTFSELDPDWIASYIETGDPLDKAGSYGVQGKAAEKISRIEGSFYGVMGLPLYETAKLLKRAQVLF